MPDEKGRQRMLLGGMLGHIMQGKETVSFKQLAKDLDFMDRTTSWRKSWKILMDEKKFIEIAEGTSVFTGEFQLTKAGKDHAATPEYLEYINELNFVPQTNEEHQARIKKRLINDKGRQIFDLLLTYGSLSRKELSTILQCSDRQHKFSYGLKDLKTKALVEVDDSASKHKFRLADRAFLSPDDRPVAVDVNPKVLREGALVVESKRRSTSKNGNNKESAKSKKRTKPAEPGDGKEEEEGTKATKKVYEAVKKEDEGCKKKKSKSSKSDKSEELCGDKASLSGIKELLVKVEDPVA